MCGRFDFHGDVVDIEEAFGVIDTILAIPPPCYNIAPGMPAAVLLQHDAALTLQTRVFGWERRSGGVWINVRSETYHSNPAVQPCAILAQGFYEWQRQGTHKQPYYIRPRHAPLFALAGLQRGDRFAVLTCAPNELISPLHHRMPVLLDAQALPAWLQGHAPTPPTLAATAMQCHPVAQSVNSARYDGPQCIVPIRLPG